MAIKHSKITINLEQPAVGLLASLAKLDSRTVESFVKQLVLDEIERREDEALCALVQKREAEDNGERVSHEDAWKNATSAS